MFPLFESIRLLDGVFSRIDLHQARINNSCRALLGQSPLWLLQEILSVQTVPSNGLYKCRVEYDLHSVRVEFISYQVNSIQTLKLVMDNEIKYEYKFTDRSQLNESRKQKGSCDDILIVKNGLLTDTLYANIVFQKGDSWFTPGSYLLPGTMRQYLINSGKLKEATITENNFRQFDRFKLINAMLEWDSPEIDVSNIE